MPADEEIIPANAAEQRNAADEEIVPANEAEQRKAVEDTHADEEHAAAVESEAEEEEAEAGRLRGRRRSITGRNSRNKRSNGTI
ncbi:hypothetical protein OROHE_018043 [Orobanche hederae]